MSQTPDTIFPSNNEWGIPTLDISMQGDYIDLPCLTWGQVARKKRPAKVGTWNFYTDDYRFSAIWGNPQPVVDSGCVSVIEPNYTIGTYTSPAQALWLTYQKRWLARYWQTKGIRVFVDLFVGDRLRDINFLGVPKKWAAYATRYQAVNQAGEKQGFASLEDAYQAAHDYHGEVVRFVVYGGRKPVERFCAERGWFYVPDTSLVKRGVV